MSIPVIVDTDIGSDIDDVWALALMLVEPRFDVRLVIVGTEDVEYKARLVAKMLIRMGKRHIPVAKGVASPAGCRAQLEWLDGFDAEAEGVTITDDYRAAFLRAVESCPGIAVVGLGPMTTLASILAFEPEVAARSRLYAMGAAVDRGYLNECAPGAEYNVIADGKAFDAVLRSGWMEALFPLDVCRDFILTGPDYETIATSEAPAARAVMENYRIWQRDYRGGALKFDEAKSSSVLYDLLPPLYLLFPDRFRLAEERLTATVEGLTPRSASGSMVRYAAEALDTAFLQRKTAEILCGGGGA